MRSLPSMFICLLLLIGLACGSAEERIQRSAASASNASVASSPDGMAVFRKYCVTCHGADGKLGLNGAKDLTACILPLEERINVITYGRKVMTPFNEVLTAEEIKAVAEYTLTLSNPK